MDYYAEFSSGAIDRTKALVSQRDALVKTIEIARKNLASEQEISRKLKSRIDKLKNLSSESLTDDTLSFEKFKTNLRKLNTELETSEDACRTLENEIIPQKQAELQSVRGTLKHKLRAYRAECLPVGTEQIRLLLDAAVKERRAFDMAFCRISQDLGCGTTPLRSDCMLHKAFQAFECSKKIKLPKREVASEPEPNVVDNPKHFLTGNIEPPVEPMMSQDVTPKEDVTPGVTPAGASAQKVIAAK